MRGEVSSPERSSDPNPEVIGGRYTVQEVVGRGGMGAVYRVNDRHDGKPLALKRLTARGKNREGALSRFEREFHTLAQLAHPRIIDVYDYGIDAQGAFYTMELLQGADMRELSPLPWRVVCRHLREVATSLALLHARKLVHRDVTPRNVRMTPDGHCKLIDFGALTDFGDQGSVVGTPPCVPPEAVEGRPIDQRLDIYALGCLGYWMLTGRHAYPATDSRQLRTFWAHPARPPSAVAPERGNHDEPLPAIPAELDALVLSLIQLDPMARPSSAGAVIDRLDVILGHEADEEMGLAASYLASAPLVGRSRELAEVQRALTRTRRGRGQALHVRGEGGVGRSRLLTEVALRAKLRGFTAIRADAEGLGQEPYGVAAAIVRGLLEVLPEGAEESLRVQAPVLGHVVPEMRSALAPFELQPRPADAAGWRSLCLSALRTCLAEVANARPLCLLVDDAHRADEPSLLLLGTLARECRNLPLLVVTASREDDEPISRPAQEALQHAAQELVLSGLGPRAVGEWLQSVFGDAPNLPRVSRLLHERAEGNPAAVMELLGYLLDRGHVHYRDGTWELPHEPERLDLPARVDQARLSRLSRLNDDERKLAATLSTQRAVITLELAQRLSEIDDLERLQGLVDALVGARVLQVQGDGGHRFSSEALREQLRASIPEERRPRLHRRVAAAILDQPHPSHAQRLAAGLHLLDADDERGVALIVEASAALARDFDGLGSSITLLEQALDAFRARGTSDAQTLVVLTALGTASYLVERSLERHTPSLLDTFDRVAGLGLARRLQDSLGRLGALIGLGIGALRYWLSPRRNRPLPFMQMMQLGTTAAVCCAGRAGICLDRNGVEHVLHRLAPMAALPETHPGGFAHAFCRGLVMVTEDRYDRVYRHMLRLERVLRAPGSLKGVEREGRRLWEAGTHYVLGVMESFRGDPAALERAAALEATGIDLNQLIAAQIRLQYHGFRGEAEEVRHAHDRLDACAIQTGTSWQVQAWSAIVVNLFGGLWGNVIIAKRAMKETARMAREIPSLQRYAVTAEATYMLQRGKPLDAVRLYNSVLPDERPLSRIGWSVSQGILASAHNELDEHDTARQICEWVLNTVDDADAPYSAMRIAVEVAYVVALGELEDYAASEAHVQTLLERYEPSASPFILGAVHEAAARVAWRKGDRKTFTHHLKEVERHFTTVGNPALIARFQRLTDVAGSGGGIGAKIAVMREVNAFHADLTPIGDPPVGARRILSWLMQKIEGYEGYLFARGEEEPELIAASSDAEPEAEIFAAVREALEALGGDGDTTNFGTEAATQTRRDGTSRHLFMLSYLETDDFHGEGALVLLGRGREAPPVRYELLQAAAEQLARLRTLQACEAEEAEAF
ncbi:MAG: AAA family ATPase [Myxococcales bacterium]